VRNAGSGATTEATVVRDTLPAGVTFDGATGDGWSCSAAGQNVTCTRTAALGAGEDAPELRLRTRLAASTVSGVTNTARVSSLGDTDASNDESTVEATVGAIDLAIAKRLSGALRTGEQATYLLSSRTPAPPRRPA
jgi:hypothetical protein